MNTPPDRGPFETPEAAEEALFAEVLALASEFRAHLPSQRIATTVESAANPIRREEWEASR